MYCDAHSAFNDGDGGGNGGGCRGGRKENIRGRERNVPIGNTSDGALLELHHVAGQSPRLVRENVFHLCEQKRQNNT